MLEKYPHFKRGEFKEIYSKLPIQDTTLLKEFRKYCEISANPVKVEDMIRHIVQLRLVTQIPFENFNLKHLREFLAVLNGSYKTDYSKNDVKVHVKKFLKWNFKDWSERFDELKDVKTYSSKNLRNEKKINSKTILKKEDIEKIMKHENKLYWKAFIMTLYEGGLRTGEVRCLKWNNVSLNSDGDISEVSIFSPKTKRARTTYIKDSTFYLNKLKEEQENTKSKGAYIFHSKRNLNKPIDKASVSCWMRNLSQKALGRRIWCYLLRHSRATELYRLARANKISKDTAIKFMGHSEDMSDIYTHLDKEDVRRMLTEQVYRFEELPPEKKHKLEKDVEKLKNEIDVLKSSIKKLIFVAEEKNII